MNLPSLRQLQYLAALADHRSFSRAAETCHVTQSTLSAGIAALESLLGQPLVDRAQKRTTLTAFGEETLERARDLIAGASAIVERAQHMNAPMSGPLRMGIIPTIAPYMLPRILPGLQKKFPALELQLHEDLSARIVESLQRGALDLILLAFPFDTPGMEQYELFSEPFFLACPKGLWKKAPPVRNEDLRTESLILLEEGHCLRDHALAACKLQPAQQRRTFSATSLPTLIQMVRHGYGITLLPEMAVKHGHLPEDVEFFSFRRPSPQRKIGLAWRQDHTRGEEFRILGAQMVKSYGYKQK